jgi:hypothetical protein
MCGCCAAPRGGAGGRGGGGGGAPRPPPPPPPPPPSNQSARQDFVPAKHASRLLSSAAAAVFRPRSCAPFCVQRLAPCATRRAGRRDGRPQQGRDGERCPQKMRLAHTSLFSSNDFSLACCGMSCLSQRFLGRSPTLLR